MMKRGFALAFAALLSASVSASADTLYVKFVDDLPQREREAVMEQLAGDWQQLHFVDDDALRTLRAKATERLGRPTADLTAEMRLTIPAFADEAAVLAMLHAMPEVEVATVEADVEPCTPPNYANNVGHSYIKNPPGGVGATTLWDLLGIRGQGVKVACIDGVLNTSHLDLPPVTFLGPMPEDPGWGTNHSTAALGMVVAKDNGWGTVGIAPQAKPYFAGVYYNGAFQTAAAVTTAAASLGPGDVIFLEVGASVVEEGVPMEYNLSVYNAVVAAVGNGIVVIEPAGNAQTSLDDPDIAPGSAGHFPFLPANDSGALIVGSGGTPSSPWPDRSKMAHSNWGDRVNVQGWGDRCYSLGYGDLYSAEGPNLEYTGFFAGTSSASANVAGAVALLQSYYKATTGHPLDPWQVRELLVSTGSPQVGTAQQPLSLHIGPRPNLVLAIFGTCAADLSLDGEVDSADLGVLLAGWGASEPGDLDGSGAVDGVDLGIMLSLIGQPCM